MLAGVAFGEVVMKFQLQPNEGLPTLG